MELATKIVDRSARVAAIDHGLLHGADCVPIIAGYRAVDYARVVPKAKLVIDIVKATAGLGSPSAAENRAHIVRVGAPQPPG